MKLCLNMLAVFVVVLSCAASEAQETPFYSRLNTFSIYAEYSNTSSYIEWGVARKRKLATAGMGYARRFNAPHWINWTEHASVFYEFELSPFNMIGDPVETDTLRSGGTTYGSSTPTYGLCTPASVSIPPILGQPGITYVATCNTRWTYLGGFSPVGARVNFGPHHRIQPFIDHHLGMLVAPQDVPVEDSSRVNFTFEFGAGFELYARSGRSFALEYRLHHLSNAWVGDHNPGVDSQLIKATYFFGKLKR